MCSCCIFNGCVVICDIVLDVYLVMKCVDVFVVDDGVLLCEVDDGVLMMRECVMMC